MIITNGVGPRMKAGTRGRKTHWVVKHAAEEPKEPWQS